ncbi:hypothetical protein [Candidatus Pelagibacter sp. Uisw_134_02]|uniref:hypothetical protein n=1 Tax=Candidatus Pelagibacter sp. Uisw_134_02 TaxID=3230990 RepID=UPI0039E8F344
MKNLLVIFIIAFSFNSWAYANDINEFEIAGISIGDSALNFFTLNEIIENKSYMYNNKKYAASFKELNNESYEGVQIEFKDNDNKFLIKSLSGKIFYENISINECYKKEKDIVNILKKLFKGKSEYTDHGISSHPADNSGKSKGTWHTFQLNDKTGHISVECMDWTKEMKYIDNLKVSIISDEMNEYLLNEAYK